MTLIELNQQYLNKEVRDKDGVRAMVTKIIAMRQKVPGKSPGFQVELNGRIKIGLRDFVDTRKFKVIA